MLKGVLRFTINVDCSMPFLTLGEKNKCLHPIKAAGLAALCRVFSVVQGKDRPCRWKVPGGISSGWRRRAPGKPERNAVPRKGDTMGMARAGDRPLEPLAEYHIFSLHTATPYKGAADFFCSTCFCLFPNKNTKEYSIFISGVPAIVRARFFCTFRYSLYRSRAPPIRS